MDAAPEAIRLIEVLSNWRNREALKGLSEGATSRQLAANLGVSQPTVSRLLNRLRDVGLVSAKRGEKPRCRGRPQEEWTLLEPQAAEALEAIEKIAKELVKRRRAEAA